MKSVLSLVCVVFAATGTFAKSPKEIVRSFRAPAAEAKEAVKGFLWLEAEEFADYGGWRIDTQFVHNMGSAYLITRGVAHPGGAARTKVTIPSAGTWQAWVRTRDWLPEFSPGKFALELGGRRSGTLGASGRTGWRWERAGAFELAAGKAEVALVDLAGGYARCDAVLLVRDAAYVPPEDAERLAAERDRLRGTDATPADGGAYDVVVVGAGPGGLGASIAAARHGARTLLVHDRPVLGGNNSAEQTVSIGGSGHNSWKGTVHSREGGLVEEAQIGRRFVKDFQMSTVYRKMVDAEPCLTERANERVVAVGKEDGRIAWVESVCTLSGARRRYRGTLFDDATGDGWVGIFAGAEKMAGRESFAQFREKGAPETADNLMMSGCLDDYEFHRIDRDDGFETPAWARVLPDGFDRPRINDVRAKWWLEHSAELSELDDPERARDELIRISLAYWGWLRAHPKHGAEARKMSLDEIKIHNGRREGWRLVGDVVLTVEDCRKGRIFPDAIATGGWHMDIHDPAGVTNPKGEGRWSKEILPLYTIPYRAIYSKNVPNLLMCGRGISVTHMAHGSTRLMGTVFAVGQAAGTAAALAVAEKLTPRELGKTRIGELQRRLLMDDQFILGLRYDDPANLAPQAKVTASSVNAAVDAKPEYVVDGELRPDTDSRKGKCTHAWQADPAAKGPQWLRLDFAKPIEVREIRLVFDSGLTGGAPEKPRPRTLVRDFVVEGFIDGAWRTLVTVHDNAKRLVVQKVAARELTGLRVRIDATWGLEARIQEIMVY